MISEFIGSDICPFWSKSTFNEQEITFFYYGFTGKMVNRDAKGGWHRFYQKLYHNKMYKKGFYDGFFKINFKTWFFVKTWEWSHI